MDSEEKLEEIREKLRARRVSKVAELAELEKTRKFYELNRNKIRLREAEGIIKEVQDELKFINNVDRTET